MNPIVIIDYGMGNLMSIANALNYLGNLCKISNQLEDIKEASAIILPGVGAFGQAMHNLESLNLINEMTHQVVKKKKPFLGICLGMELVAEDSEELGFHKGLGWIKGHVRKIVVPQEWRLPHIGWNDLEILVHSPLFDGVKEDKNFYFVHSFQMECDPKYVLAYTHYSGPITAAIRKENIFATQFHPEKSHENGLALLQNFVDYTHQC